jgi:hypothetical protein
MELPGLRDRLDALLGHRFGTPRVTGVVPLAGDASTRRYARVHLTGAGTPATMVVMLLADRGVAMSSDELAALPETTELPFLNVHRYLAGIGVDVPEVYVDDAAHGMVILEDIGDLPLRDAVNGGGPELVERHFRRAIDQLVLLQLGGSRHPDPQCIAFRQAFDERLYRWEFEHFIEYGIERRLGRLPVAAAAELRELFGTIAARLDREPRVLNHRDFHGWNLFVQGERIRVIDFQDALLAAAPYDLATLLGDRDTPTVVTPELERRLVTYYGDAWEAAGGPRWSRDHLTEVYRLCAVQKAFKVVGRFHFLDMVKGKPGYLRYLPPTEAQIGRLLRLLPEWRRVGELLGPYFPAWAP